MFAMPCWYCACSRNCNIPLVFLQNWSLVQSFTMTVFVFCRLPFPTFHWHLKLRDCLDVDACNLKSFSIMRSIWLLLVVLQRNLEWWHSFNFSLRWQCLLFSYCCSGAIWISIILSYCNACLGICSNLKVTFYTDITFVAGGWWRARFCSVIFPFFFFWLFC